MIQVFIRQCVLTFCFFAVSHNSCAAERLISIDGDLNATLDNPLNLKGEGKNKPKAVVLMIHGWASQMDEVGGMYQKLAEQLADQGIASLRINIRGESEGEKNQYRLTSTFDSRVVDAQIALDYLRQQFPDKPLGVVGFSLGGATALALVGNNPHAIDTVVLWSSAGNPAGLLDSIPAKVVKQVFQHGEAKLPLWNEFTITRQHLTGMLGHDVFSSLEYYRGPLLSIRGSDDYVPAQESKIFAHANASPEEFILISGADHIYHALDENNPYVDRVLRHTVRFFNDGLF